MTNKDRKEKLADKTVSLLDRLNERSLYSDADWKLAQYISNNIQDVVKMTASTLAKEAYSSAGTIVRLSKALGYSGFKELKLALIKELETSKYVHQSVDFKVPFSSYSNSHDIVNTMASLYHEGIDIVQSSLNSRQLEKIADKMTQSKRIFLFGVGDSMLTSQCFANKLLKLNYYGIVAGRNGDDGVIAENLREGDIAIFVTYSSQGIYDSYIELENIKDAFVVTITANGNSTLAKKSDELIVVKDKEGSIDEKMATFYSQLAFGFILNSIFSLVYAKEKKLKQEREIRKRMK